MGRALLRVTPELLLESLFGHEGKYMSIDFAAYTEPHNGGIVLLGISGATVPETDEVVAEFHKEVMKVNFRKVP